MNPCVSVIIPVYNVEAYLCRCIDSVLEQDLNNIEIILVDDGSPDKSPGICDTYQKMDPRIKVIHKENGGLASARNAGIEISSGQYLFFLDSDDWLEKDGLQILYDKAENTKVDFVKYRAIRSFWPGMKDHEPCMVEKIRELQEGLYDRERIVRDIYPRLLATNQLTMGPIVGACGALYRTSFIKDNGLYFNEEIKYSEDLIFSAKVVKAANSFYFINSPGIYHYFYNAHSISKSFRSDRWQACRQIVKLCEKEFQNVTEYDFSEQLVFLRWFCVLLAINERKHISSRSERYQYCSKILRNKMISISKLSMRNVSVSFKQKAMMHLIRMRAALLLAYV